jgi:hypothetical protein
MIPVGWAGKRKATLKVPDRIANRLKAAIVILATLHPIPGIAAADIDGAGLASRVTRKEVAVAHVALQESSSSSLRYRGRTRSQTFGRGRLSIRGHIRGSTLVASFAARYRLGRVKGVARITGEPTVSGDIKLSGTTRITGGTGRYANARGHGSLRGKGPLDLSRATLRQRGVVSY